MEKPPVTVIDDELLVIEKGHLRAAVLKDLTENRPLINSNPLVRLTTKPNTPPIVVPVPDDISLFERAWRAVKQILVNQIHVSTKSSANQVMPLSQIRVYYDWLVKERKTEEFVPSKDLSAWMIVNWFVTELSDTVPNLEIPESPSSISPATKSLALMLQAKKNSQDMEASIKMMESFKKVGDLLGNIQEAINNQKTEFKKSPKSEKNEDEREMGREWPKALIEKITSESNDANIQDALITSNDVVENEGKRIFDEIIETVVVQSEKTDSEERRDNTINDEL